LFGTIVKRTKKTPPVHAFLNQKSCTYRPSAGHYEGNIFSLEDLSVQTQRLKDLVHSLQYMAGSDSEPSDAELLRRFVTTRDEAAFAFLVRRHGWLIQGVCRHVLTCTYDVEDATQATLLTLARKAASIRKGQALASWLHGVAFRTAMNLKRRTLRRRRHEQCQPSPSPEHPAEVAALRELQAIVQEEIARLPENLRSVFVLCCLTGKSKPEAAQELRWKEGTVSGRLARARAQLQRRLGKRGVELTGALAAIGLGVTPGPCVSAAVVRNVLAACAGQKSALSAQVVAVADGVAQSLSFARAKLGALLGLTALVLGSSTWLVQTAPTAGESASGYSEEAKAKPRDTVAPAANPPRAGNGSDADPLPEGIVARMGSGRLRHVAFAEAAFSADGKTLVSANDGSICFWDLRTGKRLRRLPLKTSNPIPGMGRYYALTSDGKCLLTWSEKMLHIWDAQSGVNLAEIPTPSSVAMWRFAFAADGKTVAAGMLSSVDAERVVRVWDVGTRKERFHFSGPQSLNQLVLSARGEYLAALGYQQTVCLWNVKTATMIRALKVSASCAAFSPTGGLLALALGKDGIQFWDPARGKLVSTLRIPALDYIHALAFSADARILAVGGTKSVILWDVQQGRQLHQLSEPRAGHFAFAPDGKTLVCSVGSSLHLWDVVSGKPLLAREESEADADCLALSPDGRVLASASWYHSKILLWEAATGKLLKALRGQEIGRGGCCFSSDGKILFVGGNDGTVQPWEVASGKAISRLTAASPGESAQVIAMQAAPNGRRLSAVTVAGEVFKHSQIDSWELPSGKRLLSRRAPVDHFSCLSPDGTILSAQRKEGIHVEEVSSGRQVALLAGNLAGPRSFSPDSKILATAIYDGDIPGVGAPAGMRSGRMLGIVLWELATGKQFARLETGPAGLCAFSPDGRVLAVATNAGFQLHDSATGKELFRKPRHEALPGRNGNSFASSMIFGADGKTLITGLADSTILVWDLARHTWRAKQTAKLDAKTLDRVWADLAGHDVAKAQQAVGLLAAAPDDCVPFLKQHLQPIPDAEPKRVRALLRGLSSDDFAVRQSAEIALLQLGPRIEPALQSAKKEDRGLEGRQRIDRLLRELRAPPPAGTLRNLRAIQALEQTGTPPARYVVQRMTEGAAGAHETKDARAALRRLASRQDRWPGAQ
jgi:RNA polymerase sigma factor (sigma-70 family)